MITRSYIRGGTHKNTLVGGGNTHAAVSSMPCSIHTRYWVYSRGTLCSFPEMAWASVGSQNGFYPNAHLERRWGLLSTPSPSCIASCSPPQPAAPAPGLSARVGLVPPVTRFSATGRPASTCSTARCDSKRQATQWRSNHLWVRPLARIIRPPPVDAAERPRPLTPHPTPLSLIQSILFGVKQATLVELLA